MVSLTVCLCRYAILTKSMNSKTCTKCNNTKPLFDFHKNHSGKYGYAQKCKQCALDYARNYRTNYYHRVYAGKYKISEDQVKELLSNEVCEICGTQRPKHKRLCIDHCHTTGKVRGLLCDMCNKMLGHVNDNVNTLENAINYLRKYSDS